MNEKKAVFLLIVLSVFWGSGFVGCQIAMDAGLNSIQVIAGRFLVASVCVNVLFFKKLRQLTINEIKAGSVVGIFLSIAFMFQLYGLQYSTPSVNAFVTSTYVIIIPFIYLLWRKKKPKQVTFLCACMTVAGVSLISSGGKADLSIGVLLTAVCAVSYALQVIAIDHYTASVSVVSLTIVSVNFTFIVTTIVALVSRSPLNLNASGSVAIIYLGVFCTAIAFYLQTLGQKYVRAEKASIIFSTESVSAAFFSVLIYRERFTIQMILGCVIVFAATLIVSLKGTDMEEIKNG